MYYLSSKYRTKRDDTRTDSRPKHMEDEIIRYNRRSKEGEGEHGGTFPSVK